MPDNYNPDPDMMLEQFPDEEIIKGFLAREGYIIVSTKDQINWQEIALQWAHEADKWRTIAGQHKRALERISNNIATDILKGISHDTQTED